jgi:putative transcriptional regulator
MSVRGARKSGLLASIHEAAQDLCEVGAISKATLRDFDFGSLTPVYELEPDEIRQLREKANMSQATFGIALNVSKFLVSKWERGEAKPSGPSLKLLALVRVKGIRAIL